MADKYLKIDRTSGFKTEVEAKTSSAGVGDAGKIIALDANGKIDDSMMPVGIAKETDSYPASQDLAAGDVVNIYDAGGGVFKVRKAAATSISTMAHGFVLDAVVTDATAVVYRDSQSNNQLSGLTPSGVYFLSKTPGAVTKSLAGFTTGDIIQAVGHAANATSLVFDTGEPIILV